MSAKAIREHDGKLMLSRWLKQYLSNNNTNNKNSNINIGSGLEYVASVGPSTVLDKLPAKFPWLLNEKLVVKPDQFVDLIVTKVTH